MDIKLMDNPLTKSPISRRVWLVVILACTCAGAASVLWGWMWNLAPIILLVFMICIINPVWGLYVLVCSLFFPYAIWTGVTTYPADVILFLVVIGFWLHRAREGRLGLVRTPIDLPVAVWLSIMALSLVNAYDLPRGIVNWLRHVQLFLLFYAVVGLADTHVSKRLMVLLTTVAVGFAILNVFSFITSGGTERVFGVGRIPFSGILTLVIVYVTARICFEPRIARIRLYLALLTVTIFGQIANQSRGALFFTAVGILIALTMAWRWASRNTEPVPRKRAARLAMCAAVLGILGFVLAAPLFESVYGRFMAVGNAATTLRYRYFIWETAIAAYLHHPVLGIGLGQVQVWHHIFPTLRLDPTGSFTLGLGSHNTFLKYLAETGTLGIITFLWFYWKIVRLSQKTLKSPGSRQQTGHVIGLWSMALTIVIRSFVEGHAFYAIGGVTTALFFGLSVNTYLLNTHPIPTQERRMASSA